MAQAVLGVEALLEELSAWASFMPIYAEPLCSIVTNMLLRLIDEIGVTLGNFVTAPILRTLVASAPMASLLLRQPAAAHLDDVLFFQANALEGGQSFGTDTGGPATTASAHLLGRGSAKDVEDLLTQYLALRPIPVDDLIQVRHISVVHDPVKFFSKFN